MYSKVNYTIVGLFVVLFSIAAFAFAFWLAKYGLQEDYFTYKIEMKDSIAGLSKDSSVKLHGVDIGRVSQIRINATDIEKIDIYVEIKQTIPIKEDMIASTQMLGVTGLLSIEIHGGSNSAKTLVPTEDFIPLIHSKPSLLSKLTEDLGGIGEKLNTLLSRSESLLSDKNIDNVTKILDNIEQMSAEGKAVEVQMMASMQEIDTTLKEFRLALTSMTKHFAQATDDFSEIKDASIPTIEKLNTLSQNFNRVTLKVEKSLDRGDYSLKKILEPAVIDVQILTKQINSMTRELENNPSDLFFKSRKSRRGPGE